MKLALNVKVWFVCFTQSESGTVGQNSDHPFFEPCVLVSPEEDPATIFELCEPYSAAIALFGRRVLDLHETI